MLSAGFRQFSFLFTQIRFNKEPFLVAIDCARFPLSRAAPETPVTTVKHAYHVEL